MNKSIKKIITIVALQAALVLPAIAGQPVNINKADAKTIASSLDRIGESKAKAIVDYRTKHGPFTTVQQVGNVKGIGDKTLEKNKAFILLK